MSSSESMCVEYFYVDIKVTNIKEKKTCSSYIVILQYRPITLSVHIQINTCMSKLFYNVLENKQNQLKLFSLSLYFYWVFSRNSFTTSVMQKYVEEKLVL